MRLRLLVLGLVLASLGLLAFQTEALAKTVTGSTVAVGPNDTIDGDYTAFGRTVRISGVVNGDVVIVAQTISITGTVNGSVTAIARTVKLSGSVQNSVRVAAAELTISGTIGGDLITASRQAVLTRDASVGGSIHLAGGNLAVRGSVAGDITGTGGDVAIDGPVAGDASVSVASMTVTRNGTVGGSLTYASDHQAVVFSPGAVAGGIEQTSRYRAISGPNWFSAVTSHLVRLFVGMATGLFLLLLLPAPVIATSDVIRKRTGGSVAMGFITTVTWPVIAVVLIGIVIGIPLALIGSVSLMIIAWLSQVFVGLAIGRMILPNSWKEGTRGYNILAMAIGMLLLGLIRGLPFPYVSVATAVVVALIGVGGFLLAMHAAVAALRAPAPVRGYAT